MTIEVLPFTSVSIACSISLSLSVSIEEEAIMIRILEFIKIDVLKRIYFVLQEMS